MKTSIRRAGQSQVHVQQQQQRGTFSMPPNPSPVQKNFAGVREQQVIALDMAYLSSGQAEPVQFTANPVAIEKSANAWRQQINTINAAAIPVPMMQHTQSGHRVQASTWYGNIRTSESPGRPEEAIRNMVQMSTLKPSTRTANLNSPHPRETTRNLALFKLLGPRRENFQGQQVGGLSQPVERYAETAAQIQTSQVATRVALLNGQLGQVPEMRGASQGSGRNAQLIHPNMIYGNQSNSFLSQQSNNSKVYTSPAITVAHETRSAPSRLQRSLEPAGLNHRKEHRNIFFPLGAAQNVASAASSRLRTKQNVGSSVVPSAKRGQPNASGLSSQTGASESFGPQAPNALANMGAYKSEPDEKAGNTTPPGFQSPSGLANVSYPLPVLSPQADVNSNLLQQRQVANPRPDDYIIVPGEYAPIPALLPYPVSSSPIQVEQSGRTILQSQNSQKSKNRVAIAISGSPASGKSTLVYLLAAVFEGATIRDTGFAGAQTMYPVFNGRVDENPNRKGPITKVFVIHQNSYIKPVAEWPIAEWSELYPYSPAMEVMNPHIGAARIFANESCNKSYERYWEAAYKANIGVDPGLVSSSSSSHFPQLVAPTPIRISKKGPNLDCRGAVDWVKFGKAINDGMKGYKNEQGMLETDEGKEKIKAYLGQMHPNTGIPLVNSRKLEPLRERIREWIRKETAQNDRIGFPGRSVVDGSLREMLILDGSLLYLQSHPKKGAGGEKLMKACDVKLFLSTLETEAIQRCFSQREYLDPPQGIRQPEETWMFEGYISEIAW